MTEYGIWSATEDGFVEDGFHGDLGKAKAEIELARYREDDPEATVEEICDEHPEQRAKDCELCLDEDEPEPDDDEEA